jgi:hypothetical protein
MEIKILAEKMSMEEVKVFAENWYGTMIKGAVDITQNKVALGGDYHIESGELLIQHGSKLEDVWGFNIRFEEDANGTLEFDSMINIKPNLGNKSRDITDENISKKAEGIIKSWIIFA